MWIMKFLPKGEAQRRRCTKRAECLPTARRDEFQFLPNLLAARRYHLVDENARLCCTLEPMESIYRVLFISPCSCKFQVENGKCLSCVCVPVDPVGVLVHQATTDEKVCRRRRGFSCSAHFGSQVKSLKFLEHGASMK